MPTGTHNRHDDSTSEGSNGSDEHPHPGPEELAEFYRESSPSTVELASDEFPDCFSEFGGRLWHNSPRSPYPLPVDTPEQERLKALHELTKELIGANYVGPVSDILARINRQKKVLDLCSGTGTWAMEMAVSFPHVRFRGIDIVPIATRYPPLNLKFYIGDISEESEWPDGKFDLIHARDISMGVRDYGAILRTAVRKLQPGGMFLSCEWDAEVLFRPGSGEPSDATPYAPYCARFFQALRTALWSREIQTNISNIPTELRGTGAFREVKECVVYAPIGSWHSDPIMRLLGEGLCAIHERFADSVKHLLIQPGLTPGSVDALIHHSIFELKTVPGLVGVYRIAYGIKS